MSSAFYLRIECFAIYLCLHVDGRVVAVDGGRVALRVVGRVASELAFEEDVGARHFVPSAQILDSF